MSNKIKELDLVAGIRQKDPAAYEDLIKRYSERAYGLAYRITRNSEDAEEVLQDVFVSILRGIGSFQGRAAFSSWIYRITANTAFMKLRRRRRHGAIALHEVVCQPDGPWQPSRSDLQDTNYLSTRHELKARLEAAIARLPEDYRTIFVLRDIDGLSNQEVGELLQLSVPAIKSRLHRSRLLLRKKLQKFYDDYRSERSIAYGPRLRTTEAAWAEAA